MKPPIYLTCWRCRDRVKHPLTRKFLGQRWCAACLVLEWFRAYLKLSEEEQKGYK